MMSQAVILYSLPLDSSILAGQLAQSSIDMYKRDFAAYLYFAGTPDASLSENREILFRRGASLGENRMKPWCEGA